MNDVFLVLGSLSKFRSASKESVARVNARNFGVVISGLVSILGN